MKKKNDFIKQLARLKKEFLKYAEDNSAKVQRKYQTTKYFMLKNLNTINLFIVTYNLILKSTAKITI